MGLTAFSFILLPLCLFWAMAPDKLLKLMAVVSIFEAAAALTIGSFGVQPGLVPALAFMGYVVLQLLLGASYPGMAGAWRLTRPFVFMTVWAVATSYVMPRAFEDAVYVWPQKSTPPFVLTALAPNPANINQDMYLIIDCIFLVLTAAYLTKSRLALGSFIRAYLMSGFVVAAVSVWQFASRVAHLPYPESLFYSNPGWAILTEQSIGAVPRINGPFSEPAALANYMASIVCATGWLLLQGNKEPMIRWLFVAGLMTMAISTSTTGFGVLAIVGAGVPAYALLSGSSRMMASILKVALPMVLLGGLAFLAASTFVPGFDKNVSEVFSATLNKQQSSSYEERTGADLDSIAAMIDTYGLGVGWGSNRSSSLIPGLLAGVGLPGFAALLWFAFGLAGRVRAAHRIGCTGEQRLVMDACCGGITGFLLGAILSGPTITSITFFFLLGLLIACATRVQLDARDRRASRPFYAVPAVAAAS